MPKLRLKTKTDPKVLADFILERLDRALNKELEKSDLESELRGQGHSQADINSVVDNLKADGRLEQV